jgi:hypothetical protein
MKKSSLKQDFRLSSDEKEVLKNKAINIEGYPDVSSYIRMLLINDGAFESPSFIEKKKIEDKNYTITAYVDKDEYNRIIEKVSISKFNSISKYMSFSALEKDIVVIESLASFIQQLSKLGNNINQLTLLAHKGNIETVNLTETNKLLEDIWKSLHEIMKENQS